MKVEFFGKRELWQFVLIPDIVIDKWPYSYTIGIGWLFWGMHFVFERKDNGQDK